ncbi:hypothetical protein Tsubulata_010052 [Turnera subulata]|uniref:Uncharacterized protein n=1 Tax=Turnera subulata TaxID=218843 RepID=A0A9Q0G004_9ROSI|nr:hypothetical protein Tsubulata_010052 [Turnera subulata]
MATALNVRLPQPRSVVVGDTLAAEAELRSGQQSIAEITEMIHVTSLLHDDVLDDSDTRRVIGSLNFVMGNKVVSLLATVVEHLVTGETMQMTSTTDQRYSIRSIVCLICPVSVVV